MKLTNPKNIPSKYRAIWLRSSCKIATCQSHGEWDMIKLTVPRHYDQNFEPIESSCWWLNKPIWRKSWTNIIISPNRTKTNTVHKHHLEINSIATSLIGIKKTCCNLFKLHFSHSSQGCVSLGIVGIKNSPRPRGWQNVPRGKGYGATKMPVMQSLPWEIWGKPGVRSQKIMTTWGSRWIK